MSSANFEKCMARVLVYEGGYSNHPADPGGVTLEGVIQRVYDGYRKRKGLPTRPLTPQMRNRPDWIAERNEIYRIQYWDKIRGDELPPGVDLVVFDGAVNSGPVQSIKWLQRALGLEIADGAIGEATMAAVEACQNYDQLVADICGRRLAFMRQLRTWGTFGAGWSKRISSLLAAGQAWATSAPAPRAVAVEDDGGDAKAHDTDLAEAPLSVGGGSVASTGGTVTYGALDQLQNASTTLEPLSYSIKIIKYVVLAITLIIAAVTLYGIYRSRRSARARAGQDKVAVEQS